MKRKNEEKQLTGTDFGIVFSIIGIITSIILIILSFIYNTNKIIGIVLLCVCSSILCVNVNNKKNNK